MMTLDGNWKLYYCPEHGGKPDVLSKELLASCKVIPAVVPGNVELDLMRAGLLEDPTYGENLHDAAPYEYYQWIYEREFTVPEDFPAGRLNLHFDAIDTIADVYVNDTLVGSCANMFVEQDMDIDDAAVRGGTYTLRVHIHSAMNYARNKEYTIAMRGTAHRNEICWLRKAPHCFGWDIMPRLVSAGIWRSCALTAVKPTRFTETYYATPKLDRNGIVLEYACRFVTDADTLAGFTLRVKGECDGHTFEHTVPAHFVSMNMDCYIRDAKLWWPKGYGKQNLYTVTMELLRDGEVMDSRTEKIGLRTLRLERSFERGNQQFRIFVNEEKVFIRGTNWVPLDALHSRDAARMEQACDLLDESGVNAVRCWGGNVYESDRFFERCDEMGVLVWQDFAMGNTNYPQTDDFVPALEEEIGKFMRRVRNHPSVMLWSSDNEIDLKNMGFYYPTYDARYNRVSHETLRRIVQAHDPYRFYLCSSPEIPEGFTTTDVPEQHTWGPRAWFKDDFYRLCNAKFIGEAGYHGCPAPESIRRFMPADKVWPMENKCWAMHSTEDIRIEGSLNSRNHLMANQVDLMFGSIPEDMDRFAQLSQIVQAEAMKFFVEHARALKWDRNGIIWWNLIDGWPQISDSVVDYYFVRKRAFYYLKRAQWDILLMMDEPSGWSQEMLAVNDTRENAHIEYTLTDADSGEELLAGAIDLEAGGKAGLGHIPSIISRQRLLIMRWKVNGKEWGNHYLTGMPAYDPDTVLRWAKIIDALPEGKEL